MQNNDIPLHSDIFFFVSPCSPSFHIIKLNIVVGWRLGPSLVGGLQSPRQRWPAVPSAMSWQSGKECFLLMYIYRDLLARLIIHSPTHASIHPSIEPSIVLLAYLLIRLLAFFLLFWLGSASDHRPHTPITTLFQCIQISCQKHVKGWRYKLKEPLYLQISMWHMPELRTFVDCRRVQDTKTEI